MSLFPLSNLTDGTKWLWTKIAGGKDADNAALTVNPIPIGGRYSTTPATRGNGDAVTWEMSATGSGLVQLSGRYLKKGILKSFLASAVLTGVTSYAYGSTGSGSVSTVVPLDISLYTTRSIKIVNNYTTGGSGAAIRLASIVNSVGIVAESPSWTTVTSNVEIPAGTTLTITKDTATYGPTLTGYGHGLYVVLQRTAGVVPDAGSADIYFAVEEGVTV